MLKKWAIKMINWYQREISPNTPPKCRFTPTCSQYAKECYENFNFFKASFLTLWRLLRCNPFHKMAYDPVPIKKKKEDNDLEEKKCDENVE